MYEGRTRGKRMRYTFSDDEDETSDAMSTRKLNQQSGVCTPVDHVGPTITASGRQVRSRLGGMDGETILADQRRGVETEKSRQASTSGGEDRGAGEIRRPRRAGRATAKRALASPGDELDDESEAESLGKEWSGDEDEPDEPEADFEGDDEEEDDPMNISDSEPEEAEPRSSLIVRLDMNKGSKLPPAVHTNAAPPSAVEERIKAMVDTTCYVTQPAPHFPRALSTGVLSTDSSQSPRRQPAGISMSPPQTVTTAFASRNTQSPSPERSGEPPIFPPAQAVQL